VVNITINGNPVEPEHLYKIVSSDQVVGYLNYLFAITPENLNIDTLSVFQVVLDYLVATTGFHEQKISPDQFELGINYPNPFNPSTAIPFTLGFGQRINLAVYDILGRKVCTLVSGWLPSGRHVYTWNGRNEFGNTVASGIYYYRLTINEHQITHKMVLIR
jgi:hypothetical protein